MVKAMIVKFCTLLETKGPRQQTKFDPRNKAANVNVKKTAVYTQVNGE